jgi:dolichyl-diphosphooligosaccharide--protein glycosyltransferase
MLAVYFSSVMIRLLLAAAPATCILSGIGLSYIVQEACAAIRVTMYDFLGGGPKILPKKKRKYLPCEFALVGLGLIGYLACKVVWHGSWTGAEAYSHPTIVMCKF